MRYVVRHYGTWNVVRQQEGGYTTDTVARHKRRWVARLHAWWLNRRAT